MCYGPVDSLFVETVKRNNMAACNSIRMAVCGREMEIPLFLSSIHSYLKVFEI